jgi:hypothetical protein
MYVIEVGDISVIFGPHMQSIADRNVLVEMASDFISKFPDAFQNLPTLLENGMFLNEERCKSFNTIIKGKNVKVFPCQNIVGKNCLAVFVEAEWQWLTLAFDGQNRRR